MSIAKVERGVWSLIEEGRQYEVRIDPDGDGFAVTMRGRRLTVKIEDPRAWNGGSAGKYATGAARIVSPMPGKVVRVLVAVGDRVAAGQGVVVVEAMKMQNELKCPIEGVVKQVSVTEGATVTGNQLLVLVEADAG